MKLFRILLILLLPSLVVLTSCGSDDDDNGGGSADTQQPETDPACLTEAQRTQIDTILDRATSRRTITGTGQGSLVTSEGQVITSSEFDSTFQIIAESDTTWNITEDTCEGGDNCFTFQHNAAFRNGCFEWNGDRATIRSTSENQVSFTTQDGDIEEIWIIPESGTVRFNTATTVRGQRLTWNFTSDDGGGTTGGDTGGTDGGTEGGL